MTIGFIWSGKALLVKFRAFINDPKLNESEFNSIVEYQFDEELFYVSFHGVVREIRQFDKRLREVKFIEGHISGKEFSCACYNIIKQLNLDHVELILGSYNEVPYLYSISMHGIETNMFEKTYIFISSLFFSREQKNRIESKCIEALKCDLEKDFLESIKSIPRAVSNRMNHYDDYNDIYYSWLSG